MARAGPHKTTTNPALALWSTKGLPGSTRLWGCGTWGTSASSGKGEKLTMLTPDIALQGRVPVVRSE